MVRYSSRFLINKQKMFQFKIRLAEGPGLQILSWVSQTNIKRAVITGHGGGVLGQNWPELNQQWNAHFYGFVVAIGRSVNPLFTFKVHRPKNFLLTNHYRLHYIHKYRIDHTLSVINSPNSWETALLRLVDVGIVTL